MGMKADQNGTSARGPLGAHRLSAAKVTRDGMRFKLRMILSAHTFAHPDQAFASYPVHRMTALSRPIMVRSEPAELAEYRRALAVQQAIDIEAGQSPRGAANRVLGIGVSLYLRQALRSLPPEKRAKFLGPLTPLRSKPIGDSRKLPSFSPRLCE